MSVLPHHAPQRATRVPLNDTSAVLRFSDGRCKQGELRTVSFTGGLLSIPQSMERGSSFKLMFLSQAGPIMGNAELLNPISHHLQPFRFVSLHPSDQRKLGTVVLSSAQKRNEEEWIEKYRFATAEQKTPRRGLKVALGAATLVMLSLASVFYAYHTQLLK